MINPNEEQRATYMAIIDSSNVVKEQIPKIGSVVEKSLADIQSIQSELKDHRKDASEIVSQLTAKSEEQLKIVSGLESKICQLLETFRIVFSAVVQSKDSATKNHDKDEVPKQVTRSWMSRTIKKWPNSLFSFCLFIVLCCLGYGCRLISEENARLKNGYDIYQIIYSVGYCTPDDLKYLEQAFNSKDEKLKKRLRNIPITRNNIIFNKIDSVSKTLVFTLANGNSESNNELKNKMK